MTEMTTLPAARRAESGSRSARRYRAQGRVPAVLYGHKEQTISLTVELEALEAVLRKHAHGLLEIQCDGAAETAIIKDLQYDVFGREILHVDFARVSKGETVVQEVPILLRGTAPGLNEGGILDHQMHEIELECPVTEIQESVLVNLNHLHLGEAILVKDLELSPGVKTTADPEQIVVQVVTPTEEPEEEEAIPTSAEPELIRREDKKDEESE